ncbi:MAG: FixH family protein [Desulfobacterales bacterium]|nr:FixH family protein [Desulfobacterales bacterium]
MTACDELSRDEVRRQKEIYFQHPRQLLQQSRMFFLKQKKREGRTLKMHYSLNIFMILLLAVLLLTFSGSGNAGDKYRELINCDLHQGACTGNLSGSTVTLTVTPRPVKAMQELLFQVTFSAKLQPNAKLPYIDLLMPGMKMGPNRVQLKSAGNDTYEGRGVIVKCPSGRRTWRAGVTVPEVGQTDFIFDVIY